MDNLLLLRQQQIPLMHRSFNTTRTANLSRLSATPAIFPESPDGETFWQNLLGRS